MFSRLFGQSEKQKQAAAVQRIQKLSALDEKKRGRMDKFNEYVDKIHTLVTSILDKHTDEAQTDYLVNKSPELNQQIQQDLQNVENQIDEAFKYFTTFSMFDSVVQWSDKYGRKIAPLHDLIDKFVLSILHMIQFYSMFPSDIYRSARRNMVQKLHSLVTFKTVRMNPKYFGNEFNKLYTYLRSYGGFESAMLSINYNTQTVNGQSKRKAVQDVLKEIIRRLSEEKNVARTSRSMLNVTKVQKYAKRFDNAYVQERTQLLGNWSQTANRQQIKNVFMREKDNAKQKLKQQIKNINEQIERAKMRRHQSPRYIEELEQQKTKAQSMYRNKIANLNTRINNELKSLPFEFSNDALGKAQSYLYQQRYNIEKQREREKKSQENKDKKKSKENYQTNQFNKIRTSAILAAKSMVEKLEQLKKPTSNGQQSNRRRVKASILNTARMLQSTLRKHPSLQKNITNYTIRYTINRNENKKEKQSIRSGTGKQYTKNKVTNEDIQTIRTYFSGNGYTKLTGIIKGLNNPNQQFITNRKSSFAKQDNINRLLTPLKKDRDMIIKYLNKIKYARGEYTLNKTANGPYTAIRNNEERNKVQRQHEYRLYRLKQAFNQQNWKEYLTPTKTNWKGRLMVRGTGEKNLMEMLSNEEQERFGLKSPQGKLQYIQQFQNKIRQLQQNPGFPSFDEFMDQRRVGSFVRPMRQIINKQMQKQAKNKQTSPSPSNNPQALANWYKTQQAAGLAAKGEMQQFQKHINVIAKLSNIIEKQMPDQNSKDVIKNIPVILQKRLKQLETQQMNSEKKQKEANALAKEARDAIEKKYDQIVQARRTVQPTMTTRIKQLFNRYKNITKLMGDYPFGVYYNA